MSNELCIHGDHAVARERLVTITRLAEVICCHDCADQLLESGEIKICKDCLSQAETDLRKQVPLGAAELIDEVATGLEVLALGMKAELERLRRFEGEHALAQLLDGGAALEMDANLNRVQEVGQVEIYDLLQIAQLYRLLVGKQVGGNEAGEEPK
jgi:hypothetical protein